MKPLAFDLRGAQKVSGDKKSSTFHLKNGHTLTISHDHLPALQRKQLERIPMAQGGEVGINGPDYRLGHEAHKRISQWAGNSSIPMQEQTIEPDQIVPEQEGAEIAGLPMGDKTEYAEGGEVAPDISAYKDMAPDLTAADVADLAAPVMDKRGNPVRNQDFQSPQAQGARAKEAAIVSQYPAAPAGQDDISSLAGAASPSSMAGNIQAQTFDSLNKPAVLPKPSANDPYGMNQYYQEQMRALNQQQAGAMQENTVNANVGRYRADLEQQYQDSIKAPLAKFQEAMAHLTDQGDKIANEVATGAIDPKHYVKNMSTGSKIAAGLGMLAGGIFSANTGQPNPAFQAVQQHIKDDIDAQKANLGAKQTLLNFNLAQTGNLFTAEKLTEFQTNAIFESKFRSAAAQATNQLEGAKNLQVAGMFSQKKAELAHQISVNQALIGSSGQSSEQSFQNRMQFLRMNGQEKMADELEKKHIPGLPGQSSVPVTPANNDEWRTLSNLQKSYNDAQDYMNNVGKLGAGWQNANKARGQSIMDAMTLNMGELADLKRFTPEEKKLYVARVPDLTGTHFTGQDQALLSQLQKELSGKTETFKSSLGYPTARAKEAPSVSNNAALNWARAHPKDPRAGRILKKLGVK